MIKTKVIRGWNLYNLYSFLFKKYMFDTRYEQVSHKLLKRFIAHQYVKSLRGR